MNKPGLYRRRNYNIKKRFQGLFVIKIALSLLLGLILSMSILVYSSGNTITADYSSGKVNIQSTSEAILPYILLANGLAAVLVVVVSVLIAYLFSHKTAGPLFRFEKSIRAIKEGELTYRIHLRGEDHLKEMEEEINLLSEFLDHKIGSLQDLSVELTSLTDSYTCDVENGKDKISDQIKEKMAHMTEHLSMFKTTKRSI